MKNILLTGATGMIGGLILQDCLQRADVAKVTSVVRKPTGVQHPKLVEIVHDNFLDFSPIADQLKHQDICFFCIGVYTGQAPPDKFKEITVGYTEALAKVLKANSPNITFCFLSGQGADSTEKSRVLFAREKGIAENILFNMGLGQVYSFRPGYIYPSTPRKEPNFSYVIFRVAYRWVLRGAYPNVGLTSMQLAKAMVKVGWEGAAQRILENKDIRNLTAP